MLGEEEGRGFIPRTGMILSEPVSQYKCMNLPKIMEHIKTMEIPSFDILSILLSGQSASLDQFKSFVLESQRPCGSPNAALQSYRRKITYHLITLLVGFFHKLNDFSAGRMLGICCIYM